MLLILLTLFAMKKTDKNEQLNTESKPKKKFNKKAAIIYTSIAVPVIALGVVGGILIGQNVFKKNAYGDLKADDINEDYSAVYEQFKKTKKEKYFENFSEVELANISLLKLTEIGNYYTITSGSVVAAGVNQTIHSTYIKNNGSYFEETITESTFVKGANRFYEGDTDIDWHKGKYVNGTSGDYSSAKLTEYTKEDFENTWGKQLSRICIYIVTDQTYIDATTTDNGDGTYTLDLNMDPTLSVLRYIKQMTMTGGLSQPPVFHSVNLKFVVDSDINLIKFMTYEVYDVHMVIDANNSVGQLTQEFVYNERKIPDLSEPTNYEK